MVPDDTPVAMRQATHRRVVKSDPAEGGEAGAMTPKSDASGGDGPQQQHRQFLGTPVDAIPQVDLSVTAKQLPPGVTMADANMFENLYKEHCEVSSSMVY